VCSDGLWNYRPEAAGLAALLALPSALGDPLGAASSLVRFAVEAGGMDNITVALIPLPVRTATVPIPVRTATVPVPTATPPAPLQPGPSIWGAAAALVARDARGGWQTRGIRRWRRCGGSGAPGAGR
jgi:hypothetical protein